MKRVIVGVSALILVSVVGVGTSALAMESDAESAETTVVTIPLDVGVTLDQAIQVAGQIDVENQIGFRIDNGAVVGEYLTKSGQSPDDFLERFDDLFGTQPRIVGILAEVTQTSNVSQSARSMAMESEDTTDVISTNLSDFQAAEVPAEHRAELLAYRTGLPAGKATRSLSTWAPEQVWSQSQRSGGHQYFNMSMSWYAASPHRIPSGFGLEAGIDVHNGADGIRPFCGAGYRDQFIAKNYGWYSWFAWSQAGTLSATNPYPDYNDLTDECGRNSIRIGFQHPQNIPWNLGDGATVDTFVDAPIGTTDVNLVSGTVDQVDNGNCAFWWGALTDCMGTLQQPGEHRLTLNEARLWFATPNIGWMSEMTPLGPTAVRWIW